MKANIMQKEECDIVIIGAGGAGLMAAYEASQSDYKIFCVSKTRPTYSHTVAAKGGINAALGNVVDDDWRFHAFDTIKSGHGLADHDSVSKLCKNAPEIIYQMENLGMSFSRLPNGKIYQRAYGGQTTNYGKGKLAHRACAVADRTGQAIIHTLYQKCLENKVRFLAENFALNILKSANGEVAGVLLWDIAEGNLRVVSAKAIILATGGFGYLYKTTTSSSICTGDAAALVSDLNIPLMDMEFVQFHPTGLYQNGFLVSEAARAEGGVLRNGLGERFMHKYDPLADLACRDVIARAILQEIKEGRGCGKNKDYIELDLSALSLEEMKNKIPSVYEAVKIFAGVSPLEAAIPILPSAHYTMGGVPVDADCRVSYEKDQKINTIKGLYAIGEAACSSVHGANRLGCNSLLEILVFGKEVIKSVLADLPFLGRKQVVYEDEIVRFKNIFEKKDIGELELSKIKNTLADIMSIYAGVFRDEKGLDYAKNAVLELEGEFSKIYLQNSSLFFNGLLQEYLEVKNLLISANAVLNSAMARKECRGAHFRYDYVEVEKEEYKKHSLYFSTSEKIYYQKVRLSEDRFLDAR